MKTYVFDEWRDKPLDEVLYICRELTEDPDYPTVKRWRARGGKVVGRSRRHVRGLRRLTAAR